MKEHASREGTACVTALPGETADDVAGASVFPDLGILNITHCACRHICFAGSHYFG